MWALSPAKEDEDVIWWSSGDGCSTAVVFSSRAAVSPSAPPTVPCSVVGRLCGDVCDCGMSRTVVADIVVGHDRGATTVRQHCGAASPAITVAYVVRTVRAARAAAW